MSHLHNKYRYQKSIAWLFIVTILTLLLLPIQIHIHHDMESGSHDDHSIDYHMMMDEIEDTEHFSHSDTHVLETTTDFIGKQKADNLFKVAVFTILFMLVSLQTFSCYQRRYHLIHIRYQKYYCLSPPLRAPPL